MLVGRPVRAGIEDEALATIALGRKKAYDCFVDIGHRGFKLVSLMLGCLNSSSTRWKHRLRHP